MSCYIREKMGTSRIKELTKRLFNIEFVRFAIVGVIATAIHYGIYLLLKTFMNVNVSYTAGYLVSLACNFYLSARFTFQADTSVKKGIGFIASHTVNYILHMVLLNIFIGIGIAPTYAPIPVYCIAIPVNFLLVRTVFRKL